MSDELTDGEVVRGDIAGHSHFPDKWRRSLNREEVLELVEKLKPGLSAPGNVEKRGNRWVLRLTYNRPQGGVFRASQLLPDAETAEVIKQIIIGNREKWKVARRATEARRNKERFDQMFGRSKDDDAAAGVPA